jgi:RimJ/RimL family protein N-acetyltransferase
MMSNEQAARYIGGVQPKPVVWRAVMSMAGAWTLTGVAMFSIIEKTSGLWIGRVGPWQPYGWPGSEVAWSLHPDAWGKGYAVEAARAAIDYAFEQLGWDEVIHCINPQNTTSQLLAQRVGASKRGAGRLPEPFEHEPIEIWGQTRAQWARERKL